MGLYKGKVQSIFMGSYILPSADVKEGSTYQGRRYEQKRKKGNKKRSYLSRRRNLVLDSGA
jgi:hypothetical protein